MTELRPGTSPPPVRIPIRFFAMTTPLYQATEFVIPAEPQRRQVYAACASLAACGESWNPATTAAVYWIPDSRASPVPRNDESVFVRFGISAFSSTRPSTLCASGPLSRGGDFLPERGTHPCQPLRDSPRHLARMRERSKRGS